MNLCILHQGIINIYVSFLLSVFQFNQTPVAAGHGDVCVVWLIGVNQQRVKPVFLWKQPKGYSSVAFCLPEHHLMAQPNFQSKLDCEEQVPMELGHWFGAFCAKSWSRGKKNAKRNQHLQKLNRKQSSQKLIDKDVVKELIHPKYKSSLKQSGCGINSIL